MAVMSLQTTIIQVIIYFVFLVISIMAWAGVFGSPTYCLFPTSTGCCTVPGWTDLYCNTCNSDYGCSYQSVCTNNPSWESCCFENSCTFVPSGTTFYVCATGSTNQGFTRDPMCDQVEIWFVFTGYVMLVAATVGIVATPLLYCYYKRRQQQYGGLHAAGVVVYGTPVGYVPPGYTYNPYQNQNQNQNQNVLNVNAVNPAPTPYPGYAPVPAGPAPTSAYATQRQ